MKRLYTSKKATREGSTGQTENVGVDKRERERKKNTDKRQTPGLGFSSLASAYKKAASKKLRWCCAEF